jgi:putative toxin-antitoxin system antitoxin component (TIGR02293 family)
MAAGVFTFDPPRPTVSKWEKAAGVTLPPGIERIEHVARGVPATSFDAFVAVSGATSDRISSAIHMSVRSVQRRKKNNEPLPAPASERLVRLAELYARAEEVIGSEGLAKQWMQTPRSAFGGKSPLEMASSELGAREVEDLLGRVEHGVFH